MYPADITQFTFETDTETYIGMGSHVVSGKRHAFDDYERSTLAADIESMSAGIQALKSALAPSGAGTLAATEGKDDDGDHDDDDDDRGDGIKTAALIVSIAAAVLSFASLGVGIKAARNARKGGQLSGTGQSYGNTQ